MSDFYFSNAAEFNDTALEHSEILRTSFYHKLHTVSVVYNNPYLRFLLSQLLRTEDIRARLRIYAKCRSSEEQIALLQEFSKKKFRKSILRKYNKLTDEEKAIIQQLRKLNVSHYAIAKQLNRPVSTVHYYLARLQACKEEVMI